MLAKRFVWIIFSLALLLPGAMLAAYHPFWPAFAWLVLSVGVASSVFRGGMWLLVIPAGLPLLSLAPWTGWHIFDEFDILICGALAGAYFKQASLEGMRQRCETLSRPTHSDLFSRYLWILRLAVFGIMVIGLFIGVQDAGGFRFDWFADYVDALNSVRIFKASFYSFLFIPILRNEIRLDSERVQRLFATGIVTGLLGLVCVAVWERSAFPGLFQFSLPYRTIALFWEMHMGGAALDAYLVLTAPFTIWLLMTVVGRIHWVGAATFLVLCVYVWLTTFSRGVYVAVAVPLLILCVMLFVRRSSPQIAAPAWRKKANYFLIVMVLAETTGIFIGSTFLRDRMSESDKDWGGRIHHWKQGIGLLDRPRDWLIGIGLGRFPAHYSRSSQENEFSGELKWVAPTLQTPQAYVRLRGPQTRPELAGLFRLTQRVGALSIDDHQVSLKVRNLEPIDLTVSLCEKHLLYEAACQRANFHVSGAGGLWRSINAKLVGPKFDAAAWYGPRFGELAIAVASTGSSVDIAEVQLQGLCDTCAIKNPDFSGGTANWFYSGKSYYLPWHIDNAYLELLIEQGLVGLSLISLMIVTALYCLLGESLKYSALSAYLATGIAGIVLLGLISSFIDMPRVAFLLWLMIHYSQESYLHVR